MSRISNTIPEAAQSSHSSKRSNITNYGKPRRSSQPITEYSEYKEVQYVLFCYFVRTEYSGYQSSLL